MELKELERVERVEKLAKLHEEVFRFLLKKREADPSLRYTLRSYNTGERLDRGYWFLGSENNDSLYVSFWNVYGKLEHKSLMHPAILLEIDINGQSTLFIDTNGFSEQHSKVLAEIASSLGLAKQKNPKLWKRENIGIDVKKGLELFATTQRPFIDSFFKLRGVENDFPSIGEIEFTARFDKIQRRREDLKSKRIDDELSNFLKNKLFVETLQLTNINAFKSLNLSFNKQVTVFIGGNGSGKTTILRAIALGLVGVNAFEGEEDKSKINLLRIERATEIPIYASKGRVDVFYKYQGKEKEHGVTFESIDNGLALEEAKNDVENEGILTEEKGLKTLVVGFAQQSYTKPTFSNRQRPNITDIEALILNAPNNRFEEFIQWFELGLKKVGPELNDFREIVSKIIKVVNDCVRENEEDSINDIDFVGAAKSYVKTRQNPEGIPADKLSQGYRNLLGWVGFFAKRMYEYYSHLVKEDILSEETDFLKLPAVCLIDEIDTYLHPDWQYSILNGLVESFPNVQFFITSHSPFVLTSIPSSKITIYDLHTEGEEIAVNEIEENLSGADANRAADKISSHRSKRPLKLFNLLQNNIDNNRLDEAEQVLNQLIKEEKVDENRDLEILRAKRLIRTKKLLQSTKPTTL